MNETLPTHLGFIVDGNRRWAKERGLPTLEGHRRGLAVIEEVATEVFNRGIKFATFYVFSTENWNRTTEEVGYLMELAQTQIVRLAKKMLKNNVKFVLLGSKDRVSDSLVKELDKAEALTAHCTGGTMGVCFNYGGREEIVSAARQIQGEITEESLSAALYHPELPDIDMIIRTSGEQRISGFMLWRAAYAEMLFLEKYWPDIDSSDIDGILKEFARRSRRFGK